MISIFGCTFFLRPYFCCNIVSARVASAPGKVLVTGGYLVLEKPNAGLVLSTNARFYAIVKPIYEEIKPGSWAWVRDSLIIISC